MAVPYTRHHYVPQWYQKRFLRPGETENVLFYCSLEPVVRLDAQGRTHALPRHHRRAIRKCFVEDDLYTLRFGASSSTAIEQVLFGAIDRQGKRALDYWEHFAHPSIDEAALRALLLHMSTQKLRTPKGLRWLGEQFGDDPNTVLEALVELRGLYMTIWIESEWQIADASQSDTKFIVTDHPVTVYNRTCGPRSQWCRHPNDPDIRMHGTHTLFPLSLDKILILTNRSWVRNPYQPPRELRPNPAMLRNSIFSFLDIQTDRALSETEVRQINFIMKSRAARYVAAAEVDWLYPEQHVSKSDWHTYGHGYLLMPEPRDVHLGGEIVIGYDDGSTEAYDAYGRAPWEKGFGTEASGADASTQLRRFKGEFARLFGPHRRGRSFDIANPRDDRYSDEEHERFVAGERLAGRNKRTRRRG